MSRPTECARCGEYVTPIMELEARHVLATEGPAAAQVFFDEKLEAYHDEHIRRVRVGAEGQA